VPLLETPFFANIPQLDDFELMYDADNFAPSTPAEFAFVDTFQTAVLDLISTLPIGTGIYSPTCLVHCISGQPSYQNLITNNMSMSDALNAWYFNEQEVQVISRCQGWNCTNACGATNNGVPCNAGTGYKATQCLPLDIPTSGLDMPAPATDATGVPIPGDSSDGTVSSFGTPSDAGSSYMSMLRGVGAGTTSGSAAASAVGATARKSSHGSDVAGISIAVVVAVIVLCLASRNAVKQNMPPERRPLLPQL
jgi:hypothetical protein